MNGEDHSILSLLRLATRPFHERAETLVGLPRTVHSHIRTLLAFHGFLEPWETMAIQALAPIQEQLGDRRKVPLLRADLNNLGVSDETIRLAARCMNLPLLSDVPSALGSMYVFEGATLGGQVLADSVEKNLGLPNGIGHSYYRSYGQRVGPMWREFRSILVLRTPPDSYETVVRSARGTFERFCDWLALQGMPS